jgi:23S rRNA pseudouridine955/2504/2580 synthase
MPVKKIEVNDDNHGRRLDNFLLSIYKDVPKSKIYSIIRKGEVRINSGRVKPHTKINKDDIIRIPPYLTNDPSLEKKSVFSESLINLIKNNIIHEDDNYLILNKPHGLPVHGGTNSPNGVISILRSFMDDSLDLCHRIDKETSGCLVISKNKKSNRHFNEQLVLKKVNKTYLAILKGHLKKKIKVDLFIETSSEENIQKSIISDNGKEAVSTFKPLKKLNQSCLVSVNIATGRTHQIRVQANHIGHPVLNDDKYGDRTFNKSKPFNKTKRMTLHASEIEFIDQNNNLIKGKADIDDSFEKILNLLE